MNAVLVVERVEVTVTTDGVEARRVAGYRLPFASETPTHIVVPIAVGAQSK